MTSVKSEGTTLAGLKLADIAGAAGTAIECMPWVHRILAENLLRHAVVEPDAESALQRWLKEGRTDTELPFYPTRIMMHDTTCGPALVDLAAMRSALAEVGGDPRKINPVLQVDVSTDHSLAVDRFGTSDAMQHNMTVEMRRNAERFGFMKWASQAFDNLHLHPPGTGIMHTINLERLATVVSTGEQNGEEWAFPDTLIGTDSHTPMINGIGVLGWGVGGLEAESVMLGMPVMLRVPKVVGVRLTGKLREGVLATDLALTVTKLLRSISLNGCFVEFFGSGVSTLSAGDRAVVANMAPEFGGATGYFPIDHLTVHYLLETGRSKKQAALVEEYARKQHLWFDPALDPHYDRVLALDLASVQPSLAGPRRPQDLRTFSEASKTVHPVHVPHRPSDMPPMPVALAAITSCTNTSDPRLLIAAGLVARKARALGLRPASWTKTSFAPGSPAAELYLRRSGLLEDLEAIGFGIVGFGCTVCIGNSGPLTPDMSDAIERGTVTPVAVLSGNRNFPGRVHGQIDDSFLASPPLVVAYALAGDFDRDLSIDTVAYSDTGQPVHLPDLWPSGAEIDAMLATAVDSHDYDAAYAHAEANPAWLALDAPKTPLYPWDPASTYIRRPPFASVHQAPRIGRYTAYPLLILGDDVTTDHISPAGAIPRDSDAATYLVARGADVADLNVFSSRRGNWEVMLRGLFTNRAIRNLLAEDIPAGKTIHIPSGTLLPIWEAAGRYAEKDDPVVIVAGERYGMGSSRDWAAKGAFLLGARAVLAASFERIHRSNLINMGILPVELPEGTDAQSLKIGTGDRIEVDAQPEKLSLGGRIEIRIHRADGSVEGFSGHAAIETRAEIETLIAGGMLPRIVRINT